MAKKSKLGVASAIVVGAGAAALYAKKASENKQAKNMQSDALGWTKNDFVSPGSCHQACHKRIVTIRK